MPDATWNQGQWGHAYNWSAGGEEWSSEWGNSTAQWFSTLYPRLHNFVPARRILELAPGFGRWTRFLLSHCQTYHGVDYAEKCVSRCRERFAEASHASFHQNNGTDIPADVGDEFDFIFCFDSFVHIDIKTLSGYIGQSIDKLTPNGVAFFHHSNLAEYQGAIGHPHSRDDSVSAVLAADAVRSAGGKVLVQEVINWNQPELIDCLTTFSRQSSDHHSQEAFRNPDFMSEAAVARNTHCRYQARKI